MARINTIVSVFGLVFGACSDPAGDARDGITTNTGDADVYIVPTETTADGTTTDAIEASEDATVATEAADAPDATQNDTTETVDTTQAEVPDTIDPCAAAVCDAPNRGVCAVDAFAPAGYRCACDEGFVLEADVCVSAACDDEAASVQVTVIDMTALPNTPDPVRTGFDPLLPGDTVQVRVEFARTAGDAPVRLLLELDNLVVDVDSARLDGGDIALTALPSNRYEVELLSREGHITFEATTPPEGTGLLTLEARMMTLRGCRIAGAASGARIQLTGAINPKFNRCNDMSDLRSLQISAGVYDKDTSVYEQRNGSFDDISSSFKVLTQMTLCLVRPEDVTVSLAGSADGTRPWTIDNFLLIEVFSGEPNSNTFERVAAWITTSWAATAPSRYTDGTPINVLSHASIAGDYTGSRTPSPFSFPAGTVQLNDLLPAGQRVWLRLTGLDSGVAGHLSRLFIHASTPGEVVAECRSFRDCPRTDSYDGLNTQVRAGCIAGRCNAIACSAAAPCAPGQTCMQGFCNEGCTDDASCGPGQVCGAGYVCTTVGEGGCKTFADCPTGEVCFFGRCEAGCFHPVNQDPTYSANHAQYSLCKTNPAACPRCGDASSRCWNNYCRDCEIDAHCPSGQICSNFECRTP